MSVRPKLSDDEALAAEAWYSDFERVGTFEAKARELQVDKNTLRDAIRRVRGELTKCTREKLSALDIDQLTDQLLAGNTFHLEPHRIGEEQQEQAERT